MIDRIQGLVVSGTRGAGKTTLSAELTSRHPALVRVRSTTTRRPRRDDTPATYRYLDRPEFDRLRSSGQLIAVGRYGEHWYGIAVDDVMAAAAGGQPLLTVSPKSAHGLVQRAVTWRGVFIDAPDVVLDARLTAEGRPAGPLDLDQRRVDRRYAGSPFVLIDNGGLLDRAVARLERAFGLDNR